MRFQKEKLKPPLICIYTKILLTTLPIAILTLLASGGVSFYLSYTALTEQAEIALKSRLSKAVSAAAEQEGDLQRYDRPEARVTQAKSDTAAAMRSVRIGKEGFLFVVDSRGGIVAHPDKLLTGADVSEEKWFQKIRKEKRGRIRYSFQGVRYLAMYAYFPGWEWYILSANSHDEIFGPVMRLGVRHFFLGTLGSVIMALALIFLTRRLTIPLELLADGIERIGQGDMKSRVFSYTGDEFGRLAEVFNKMADKLQETLTALQSRKKLFRSLIENAPGIITTLNEDGMIRYGSPSVQRVLGFGPEELVGRKVADLIHPDDLPCLALLFPGKAQKLKVIRSGQPFRVRHKDGSWRMIEAVGKSLLSDPAVEGWVFNLRDVSERCQAEARLIESEEKYRSLFESAPEGIIITTLEGKILSVNDAFMKIFKFEDKDACLNLCAYDLYANPHDRTEMVERIRKEGQIENYEQPHVDSQGRIFPASRSLRVIQYEGRPCVQTIIRDVTQIKEMEAKLRNYAENLEKMVDEQTKELQSANERLSATIRSLEETRESLRISAHQAGMAEIAVSVLHNIGNAVNSVNVRTCQLKDVFGSREIRSLEKIRGLLESEWQPPTEAGKEQKKKLLEFFLMTLDIAGNRSDQFRSDLNFIRSGVDHIMEIIAIQQKYAGVRGYETPVNLNDILKDSAEMLTDSFRKRDIELKFSLNALPDIILDKNKMIQIFINILKNAYEAIDMAPEANDRRIRLSTSVEKEDIQVMIEDTGAGLSSEDRTEVFKFNFSTKRRGSGYGLHDSANYVTARGGEIDLSSEGPGKGACLIIKLPKP
ncbi:PAS domain S-box protein [Desulfobacterales bacterium HSG2]|nr:PAS domain S-box protein [Desulfobacterales bacterium HSG2]